MQIRTLTGTSIPEALAEARSLWGESVVMLQAEPAREGARARIAVTVPAGLPDGQPVDVMMEEPSRMLSERPAPGAFRRPRKPSGLLLSPERIRPAASVFKRLESRPGGGAVERAPVEEKPPVDERFGLLVRCGIRPTRARRICSETPMENGTDGLVSALARHLPPAETGRPPGRVIFSGEAGSGKTSLVLRSALARVRVGLRAPAIVVVAPDRSEMPVWQDPTPLFEGNDLQVVRCSGEALESALAGLTGDVLVDVPSTFQPPTGMRVHRRLIIDARSASQATSREGSDSDSVVVTHLDRTRTWGYAAERLIAMQLPVAAMVSGARLDRRIEAYTPERFAAGLCHE